MLASIDFDKSKLAPDSVEVVAAQHKDVGAACSVFCLSALFQGRACTLQQHPLGPDLENCPVGSHAAVFASTSGVSADEALHSFEHCRGVLPLVRRNLAQHSDTAQFCEQLQDSVAVEIDFRLRVELLLLLALSRGKHLRLLFNLFQLLSQLFLFVQLLVDRGTLPHQIAVGEIG